MNKNFRRLSAALSVAVVLGLGISVPVSAQPRAQGDPSCSYRAAFVADVTIPDDTLLNTGERFVKTWRVRNDGTCPWGSGQAVSGLAWWGGDRLGGPDLVALPGIVNPGQTFDVSVNMVAPSLPGVYLSEWMFKLDASRAPVQGGYLGVGASGHQPLFTRIMTRGGSDSSSNQGTRIRFAPGATQATVNGQMNGAPARDYLLRALKGQTLIVTLAGPDPNMRVEVFLSGARNPLRAQVSNSFYWRGVLPANADYVIRIISQNANARFTFTVEVPQRISFRRGAISGTAQGSTAEHRTVSYILRALANQRMTVELTAPQGVAGLTIYGLDDGQPLVRAESGATTWTGYLPMTQDYLIMVVPWVDGAFDFSVRVTVR
jgi:hypothetical protein